MTAKPVRAQLLARQLLTVEHAAELTQASSKWIRLQIKAGKLRAHRLGRAIRIAPEDFEQFLRSIRT